MSTEIRLKTYICEQYGISCLHKWQFSGDALNLTPYDLSADDLKRQFPDLPGLPKGKCPACFHRGVLSTLGLEIDLENMSTAAVATDEDIDNHQVPEFDEQELPVLVQAGEKEVLTIDNGKPTVITEPVYEPKLRELTTQELAELKQQRDRDLDKLEKIAV